MPPRTEIGTTIKLEEFEKYPNGAISTGIISNSAEDGIDCPEVVEQLLLYKVVKVSNLDWYIVVSPWDSSYTLADNVSRIKEGHRVTKFTEVKRIFNVSKKVFDLLTQ